MTRHLPSSIFMSLFMLSGVAAFTLVTAPAASAQAPDDDGWDDEEGDDWGDEGEAKPAKPEPEKPAPPKPEEEGEEDDGWGDDDGAEPAPAEPAPAEPAPAEPAPADDSADEDGWGDEEPAEAKPPQPASTDDDWGEEEPDAPTDSGAAPAEPAPAAAPEPEPEPEPTPEPPPEPEFPPMPSPPADLTPGAKLAFTAGALIDRGEFTAAEAKASLATVTPGGEVEGLIQMARLRLRQGRLREAIQSARSAVGQSEQSAPARLILLRLLASQGESVDDQVTAIERLTQRFPDDLGLAIVLAEAQLIAKQNAAAMKTARAILKRAETSVTAMKLLARAYYAAGNDATTESILERAVGIEEDAEACHLMSQVYLKRENVVQARIWLDRAIAVNPFYIEALNNLGVTFIQMRDFPAALTVLPRLTRMAPGFGAAWLNLGIAQRGAKRFTDAEQSWKEVLKVEPRMSDAWFNLGVLYLENDIPGLTKEVRLNQSIDAFNRYRHGARMRGQADKSIDTYIKEAKRLIAQEKKAKEDALKKPDSGGDDDWGDDGDDSGGGDSGGGDDDWGDDDGGDSGGDDDWGDDSGGDDDW
ncbi:MAG: tetratricopeptide repeat protein [Myxococcota bacterium]